MSKASYHVPQYREVVNFDGACYCEVALWDSKHSIITTTSGERIRVKDRSSIKVIGADSKPAEPVKEHPSIEPEHHWDDSGVGSPVAVSTAFTARLPTSFSSEVERAKAIADAEVEEKRRKALFDQKATELDENLTKILHAQRVLKEEIIADYQDYQNRVDYLRSLRVRGK